MPVQLIINGFSEFCKPNVSVYSKIKSQNLVDNYCWSQLGVPFFLTHQRFKLGVIAAVHLVLEYIFFFSLLIGIGPLTIGN